MARPTVTVSQYLIQRLKEFGAEHLFAVPGDYAGAFLSTVDKTPGGITRVGVTNEWVAGYAADAYARLRGTGACCLTYGVGTFGVLNALAGSYVEELPVALIIGSPSFKQRQVERHEGVLYHHSTGTLQADVESVKNVTVAREVISDPRRAPQQIDNALAQALAWRRPCYIEVFENVWSMECAAPRGPLKPARLPVSRRNLARAVEATLRMLDAAEKEPEKEMRPVIWAGVEVQRFGLQEVLSELIAETDLPWASDLVGKSVLSEDHPNFKGTFDGASAVKEVMTLFDASKCVLGLGALVTDDFAVWVTGSDGKPGAYDNMVLAFGNQVRVSKKKYDNVPIDAFMRRLLESLRDRKYRAPLGAGAALDALKAGRQKRVRALAAAEMAASSPRVTYTRFFERIKSWTDDSMVLMADTSIALYSAAELKIKKANGFIAQAAWNSIGYTPGAAVGVGYAEPGKRAVVFCGDGGFQEIVQAVGDLVRSGHDATIFIFNNALYGIEQAFVNPYFFVPNPQTGQREPAEDFDFLFEWNYAALAQVFTNDGLKNKPYGVVVSTMDELDAALKEAKRTKGVSIVDLRIPQDSITVQMLQQAGVQPSDYNPSFVATSSLAAAPSAAASAKPAKSARTVKASAVADKIVSDAKPAKSSKSASATKAAPASKSDAKNGGGKTSAAKKKPAKS